MENFAKALTYYLEPAEGTSKEEFINTFAYSVLVEKSGIIPLDNSSLLSTTNILNDIRDVQHPMTDSSEPISNKAKVFQLRKRLDSVATDIFVGRAPTNDIVLADPSVSKSHFRFISIPETNHHQLADMFSTNGTYINDKKIVPFEKHQVEDHDEISFGTEYQLVYYSPRAFYEMLIRLKDNESKDREQKQTADDDLALLLDSIAKEATDLAE
ncbi:MAG: FHA domain-containing protein, partial [Deltaproteobacteria bacterium]|nr:FHA domain-containing protein [Deltaproteobacteria bacterium]